MKKTALLLGTLLLVMSLALFGCSSTDDSSSGNDDSNTATEEPAAPEQAEEKTFTLDELEEYDGKDGAKAYIAVDGVAYVLYTWMAERTASDTHDPAVYSRTRKQDDFQGEKQGPSEHHEAAQKMAQADGAGACSHRNSAWISCAWRIHSPYRNSSLPGAACHGLHGIFIL